ARRAGDRLGGARPFVVVRRQRVPLRDDQANRRQHGDESQPGQLHQNDEIEPPPRLPPSLESRRSAQTPFIGDRNGRIVRRLAIRNMMGPHVSPPCSSWGNLPASSRDTSQL